MIANEPSKVGFVQIRSDPELFISVSDGYDVVPRAAMLCGFSIWGDAPILKLDFREKD